MAFSQAAFQSLASCPCSSSLDTLSLKKSWEPFDEEADEKIREAVEAAQERGSVALEASGAISDDGIIDPRDTRTVLGICLSVVRNKPIEGAEGYGVFRL